MNPFTELMQRHIWLGLLVALVVGVGIGLPIGWSTVDWKPGPDEVAAVADSYSVNNDLALAKSRLQGLSRADLTRILTNLVRDSNSKNLSREADRVTQLAQALGITISTAAAVTPVPTSLAGRTPTAPSAAAPSLLSSVIPFVVIFIVVAVIAAVALIFFLRVMRNAGARAAPPRPAAPTAPPAAARTMAPAAAPTTVPGGLGRFVASYTLGNDNYDTSFSLETSRQEFLGECGMGISETVGEGKPDKVTAFDLWLFDKADVRTVTQIIMSDYAFRDQALRSKLAAKGEPILAEKGRTITLDTQSLHIEAQVVELVYATNPTFPQNSHFQKLTVEMVPTLKEAIPA